MSERPPQAEEPRTLFWMFSTIPLLAGLLSVVAVVSAGGCPEQGAETESPAGQQTAAVEETTNGPQAAPPAPSKMREVSVTDALVNQGKGAFAACAACHGVQGEGKIGMGPRLNSRSFLGAASDSFLINTIANGRAGTTMIAWGQSLGADTVRALVAYIRSWHEVEPVQLNESPVQGNAENGAKLFREICAACHGRTGAGYQETANGTGIGRRAFLATATNGFIRHLVKHGKSQTKMRPFAKGSRVAVANLSDQEIDDVIVHLRQNAW